MPEPKNEKSPIDTANELKAMLTQYARQETVGPLQLLGKWVAFGVAGALLVAVGLAYLAFGVLRVLQSETSAFESGRTSYLPYLIAFALLMVFVGIAAWAMTRSFSDSDRAEEKS
ncbi:MAG: hypothetical protein ACE367_13435 [Acidimicrobiales bacterium]